MKRVTVKNFSRGMAADYTDALPGESAVTKNFDILTYPRRLQPLRGMTSHTASTNIGNLFVASDGYMYGLGADGSNNGKLYKLAGYGASDAFTATTNGNTGVAVNYNLFVEYTNAANARTFFVGGPSGANGIKMVDPTGGLTVDEEALTYTNLGQGFVHPKDKILYIPYDNKIATCNNSTTVDVAQFTVPSQYRIYCLTNFGDYLAIPATGLFGQSMYTSTVFLSNRDTSLTTFDEAIPWGAGSLQVLNNLHGALIGISASAIGAGGGDLQDSASILIKEYTGGGSPRLIKEIKAQHIAGTGTPSVTINPRVNFVANNRLYFSVNIVPNDGKTQSLYGLWSVGKNEQGEYTVVLERTATNTGTDTGTIAAAISGDYVEMVHTSVGTLVKTINGQTSSTTYAATSIYESPVNPDMPTQETMEKKKLHSITVSCLPLPASASITVKYRVDSDGDTADWVSCGSYSTEDGVSFTVVKPSTGYFTDGYNYEFRFESTGGAAITAYSYKYETLTTNV